MASPPSQYGAISIHVSVRRRTPSGIFSFSQLRYFNSRLRKETNENYYSNKANISYFNSRLRKETNAAFALLSPSATISIHVSVRRRTY